MTCETEPCTCGGCTSCDLRVSPFEALRVAQGMLLGAEDFEVLMGNPRGKLMLHSGWLHGAGVVWGFQPTQRGNLELELSPGLAIDALGRELAQTTTTCIDLRDWVNRHGQDDRRECGSRILHACLSVEFECTLGSPVPTLADPCDVERKHDDFSRTLESAHVALRLHKDSDDSDSDDHTDDKDRCCCERPRRPAYHRVRVLLGLDEVGEHDPAGRQAMAARKRVARAASDNRPEVMLAELRCLAADDCAELRPAAESATELGLFPSLDRDPAPVPLGCLRIRVNDDDGCCTIEAKEDVEIDLCCRTALLPTELIGQLSCGLAPGVIGAVDDEDAGGPRVVAERVSWSADRDTCRVPVTAALNPGSVRRAVRITSLSERGWVDEDIYSVKFEAGADQSVAAGTILIQLADRPVNPLVRLVIKGTGPTPVYGQDPALPLAGLLGGPPAGRHDGHDVVLTWNPIDEVK